MYFEQTQCFRFLIHNQQILIQIHACIGSAMDDDIWQLITPITATQLISMRHPILENYQYDSNTIRRRNNDLTDSFPPSLDLEQVFSNPSDQFISIATPPAESSIQKSSQSVWRNGERNQYAVTNGHREGSKRFSKNKFAFKRVYLKSLIQIQSIQIQQL
jgi:hypothetical protein